MQWEKAWKPLLNGLFLTWLWHTWRETIQTRQLCIHVDNAKIVREMVQKVFSGYPFSGKRIPDTQTNPPSLSSLFSPVGRYCYWRKLLSCLPELGACCYFHFFSIEKCYFLHFLSSELDSGWDVLRGLAQWLDLDWDVLRGLAQWRDSFIVKLEVTFRTTLQSYEPQMLSSAVWCR